MAYTIPGVRLFLQRPGECWYAAAAMINDYFGIPMPPSVVLHGGLDPHVLEGADRAAVLNALGFSAVPIGRDGRPGAFEALLRRVGPVYIAPQFQYMRHAMVGIGIDEAECMVLIDPEVAQVTRLPLRPMITHLMGIEDRNVYYSSRATGVSPGELRSILL